jgi:hypothetical protein
MLSIFTLGVQRMAIVPALLRAGTVAGLTWASAPIEEIPAMAIPPRAAPVVLRKSLLLDMPTTPFRISIVESLKVLAFSRRDHTLFCWQFKG